MGLSYNMSIVYFATVIYFFLYRQDARIPVAKMKTARLTLMVELIVNVDLDLAENH